jgi:hypothetical protein
MFDIFDYHNNLLKNSLDIKVFIYIYIFIFKLNNFEYDILTILIRRQDCYILLQ